MRRLATLPDIEAVYAIYSHESVLPVLTYEPMSLDRFEPVYIELVKALASARGTLTAQSPVSLQGDALTRAGCTMSRCLAR